MYAYMKGILVEATLLHVVLEVHDIGYKIFTPVHLFSNLPNIGEPLRLYTSFVIRENSETLYGFLTKDERELFEALQGVTGIGPKLALCIIGHISMRDLEIAVSQSDIKTISKIPGIGKKTAERLIIEMRDKLKSLFPSSEFQSLAVSIQQVPYKQEIEDAMSALINLGYNQITAQKAIKKSLKDFSEETIELGALITSALKNI